MKKPFVFFFAMFWLGLACSHEKANRLKKSPAFPLTKASAQANGYALDSLALHAKDGCALGLAYAQADEQKGILGYYFWGLAIPPLATVLSKQYGVQVFSRGCTLYGVQGEARTCYNDYMRKLLQRKYQQDIVAIESAKLRQLVKH